MAKPTNLDGPDPIDVGVGLRLRSLRKERSMSQEQLGRSLGITFQQIQKYERGTNRISASMLVKAAAALGIAPAALLPEDDSPSPSTPAVLTLLTQMRGVEELVETYARIKSPRLRRAVLQMARSLAENAEAGPASDDADDRPARDFRDAVVEQRSFQ